MQVQTQLSWSEQTAEAICQQCGGEGNHTFLSERWAYVQGMALRADLEMGRLP